MAKQIGGGERNRSLHREGVVGVRKNSSPMYAGGKKRDCDTAMRKEEKKGEDRI